ncbi:MAG: FAD-binding domain-containing protein, partial [Planctomycetota bacterium]
AEQVLVRPNELAPLPDEHLAEPHRTPPLLQQSLGVVVGRDYPEPIVDHATAYRSAKEKVYRRKGQAKTREASQRVYAKHGSRKRGRDRRVATGLFASRD